MVFGIGLSDGDDEALLLELVDGILGAAFVDLVVGEVDDTQKGDFGAAVQQRHHGIIGQHVKREI
jgi:hypothetical protein